jgi:hypothetical protein
MKKVSVNVSIAGENEEVKMVFFPASMFVGGRNGISFTPNKEFMKSGKVTNLAIEDVKSLKVNKKEWQEIAASSFCGFTLELFDDGKDGGLISTIQKISTDLDKAVKDGMIEGGVTMIKDFLVQIMSANLPKKEEEPKFDEEEATV